MEQAEAPDDPVLAVYKDQTVLRSVVDYQKQTQAALAGVDPATLSDREVVDDLLKNALLLEEAEARGLTPTQEEIEQYLQETCTPPMNFGGKGTDRQLLRQCRDLLRRIRGRPSRAGPPLPGQGEAERGSDGGILPGPQPAL